MTCVCDNYVSPNASYFWSPVTPSDWNVLRNLRVRQCCKCQNQKTHQNHEIHLLTPAVTTKAVTAMLARRCLPSERAHLLNQILPLRGRQAWYYQPCEQGRPSTSGQQYRA